MLVEIDLETDTSRMLYDTRNNRTRIVGYREGNVYLLKDHIVYKNVLKSGEQREMYDFGMRKMENIRMFILNGMEIIWLYGAITMGMGKIW